MLWQRSNRHLARLEHHQLSPLEAIRKVDPRHSLQGHVWRTIPSRFPSWFPSHIRPSQGPATPAAPAECLQTIDSLTVWSSKDFLECITMYQKHPDASCEELKAGESPKESDSGDDLAEVFRWKNNLGLNTTRWIAESTHEACQLTETAGTNRIAKDRMRTVMTRRTANDDAKKNENPRRWPVLALFCFVQLRKRSWNLFIFLAHINCCLHWEIGHSLTLYEIMQLSESFRCSFSVKLVRWPINEVGSCLHRCSTYNWSSQREATRLEEDAWQFIAQAVSPNHVQTKNVGFQRFSFIGALAAMLLDQFMLQTSSLFNWWHPMLPSLESWYVLYCFVMFCMLSIAFFCVPSIDKVPGVVETGMYLSCFALFLQATAVSLAPFNCTLLLLLSRLNMQRLLALKGHGLHHYTLHHKLWVEGTCIEYWVQLYARCLSVDCLWDENWLAALVQKLSMLCKYSVGLDLGRQVVRGTAETPDVVDFATGHPQMWAPRALHLQYTC